MDRPNKNRPPSSSSKHLGSQMIPLGKKPKHDSTTTKSSSPSTTSNKSSSNPSKDSSAHSKDKSERKRERDGSSSSSSPSIIPPPKKSKMNPIGSSLPPLSLAPPLLIKSTNSSTEKVKSTNSSTSLKLSSSGGGCSPKSGNSSGGSKSIRRKEVDEIVKEIEGAIEVNGAKFLRAVDKIEEMSSDSTLLHPLILSGIKRADKRNEVSLAHALLLLAQQKPLIFQHSSLVDSILSLTKTKNKSSSGEGGAKNKNIPSSSLQILAMNVFYLSHENSTSWPTSLVQTWVEDSCLDRSWSDSPECSDLVSNLLLSFGTLEPDKDLLPPPDAPSVNSGPTGRSVSPSGSDSSSSTSAQFSSGDTGFTKELGELVREIKSPDVVLRNRYKGEESEIENIIVEYVKELILKRSPDLPKNLIKTLGLSCGLSGVRSFVISRLEQWLHNPKTGKTATELLMFLSVNAKSFSAPDLEYVAQICKLRMKTKQLTQLFAIAIREMVRDDSRNMDSVLHHVVYNELSLQRNPTNHPVLASIFTTYPSARTSLSTLFIDLLTKREDFIVALKQMVRDMMRACRFECNLTSFISGLLAQRELSWSEGQEMKSRSFKNIVDLIIYSLFLSFTPTVKEATASRTDKNLTILKSFYEQMGRLQEEALSWLYSYAMKTFRPPKQDYVATLYKFTLRDAGGELMSKEGGVSEGERALYSRHCLEIPVREGTLTWVLLQAFSPHHSYLSPPEILDVVESLVMRGAAHSGGIQMSNPELIATMFRLTEYKYPENISLPLGYSPPKDLGITKSYWRVWIILLVISAHNPISIGKKAWDSLPTLHLLMEMCMTNQFNYPTPTCGESVEEVMGREAQLAGLEKEQILEFEVHLAAGSTGNTITEKTSILLSQLIRVDPYGKSRSPPPWVTGQLRQLNEQLKLGQKLCRCRSPDFLLEIVEKSSGGVGMPWLRELLMGEDGFETLPLLSLCEFLLSLTPLLLSSSSSSSLKNSKGSGGKGRRVESREETRATQLLSYLQSVVEKEGETKGVQIFEFFFKKLASQKALTRHQGQKILQMFFCGSSSDVSSDWLLNSLPPLPIFPLISHSVTLSLREALLVELEPSLLFSYLNFLQLWGVTEGDSLGSNLALDVSQLVVERSLVTQTLLDKCPGVYDPLFDIYVSYVNKIRGPVQDFHQWSQSTEHVLIQWVSPKSEATLNILVLHAIVLLLSNYSLRLEADSTRMLDRSLGTRRYSELLSIWFPLDKTEAPRGLLLNTTEEAVLFPDWLKLRMIRSANQRLVEAASLDLDIEQLLLFVQSFGIPVKSMTGLLYCLDKASEECPSKLVESIIDFKSMRSLVQVQKCRGASGGSKFLSLINSHSSILDDEQINIRFSETQNNTRPVLVIPQQIFKGSGRMKINSVLGNRNKCRRERGGNEMPSIKNPIKIEVMTIDEYDSEDIKLSVMESNDDEDFNINTISAKLLQLSKSEAPSQHRAYFLTVLSHESGWKTLEECLTIFLQEFNSLYDPSAVLDLISSTISNPKLWQGCEKNIPKHQEKLSVLTLTTPQLVVMGEYIVEEMNQLELKSTNFSISNLLNTPPPEASKCRNNKRIREILEERVQLWTLCAHHHKNIIHSAIQSLINKKRNVCCLRKFLSGLYVAFPALIDELSDRMDELCVEESGNCVLDSVTHILINGIAANQPTKEWAKKTSHELNLCLRKIASLHPTLLLRQLPMMSSLLEGRLHLDFNVFHSQNHQITFRVFLGLIDLMQPHINKHFKAMKPLLTLYIQLFDNYGHGQSKDYGTYLTRYCVILHNLLASNPVEMKEFLSANYTVLRELSEDSLYVELSPLQNLVSSIVPPSSSSELSILTPLPNELNSSSYATQMGSQVYNRLTNSNNNDEILQALQELDSLSYRNPNILAQFSDYLNNLLLSDDETVRYLSFVLILKHVTHTPSANKNYLKSVMEVLRSQGSSGIDTILARLPEFVILAQDNGEVLLSQMFELGLSSTTSMLPVITKTLSLLRTQTGA